MTESIIALIIGVLLGSAFIFFLIRYLRKDIKDWEEWEERIKKLRNENH